MTSTEITFTVCAVVSAAVAVLSLLMSLLTLWKFRDRRRRRRIPASFENRMCVLEDQYTDIIERMIDCRADIENLKGSVSDTEEHGRVNWVVSALETFEHLKFADYEHWRLYKQDETYPVREFTGLSPEISARAFADALRHTDGFTADTYIVVAYRRDSPADEFTWAGQFSFRV